MLCHPPPSGEAITQVKINLYHAKYTVYMMMVQIIFLTVFMNLSNFRWPRSGSSAAMLAKGQEKLLRFI